MKKSKGIIKIIIIILAVIILAYVGFNIAVPHTKAFKEALNFLQNNEEITEQYGEFADYSVIQKAEIMFGGNDSGYAEFRFNFITDTGKYRADILVSKIDGVWTVTDHIIKQR